jgi:hydrogenase-4 component E
VASVESLLNEFAAGLPIAGGVGGALDALAVGLLVLALVGVATYRLERGIWLVGGQALILAAVAITIGAATASWHVYLAAALTVLVKVIGIPAVLLRVLQRVQRRHEIEPASSARRSFFIAIALVLIAYHVAGTISLPAAIPNRHVLPVSLALMLLGLFLMVERRTALSQVLGLIVAENGVYLAALVATYGLPIAVELSVFFDVLVGVLLMGVLMTRISASFETFDTSRLNRLRH